MLKEVTSAVVNLLPYVRGATHPPLPAQLTELKMIVTERKLASGMQVHAVTALRLVISAMERQYALTRVAPGMATHASNSAFYL